jgi:hypothetical protein
MDRVLSLQNLGSFAFEDELLDSNTSGSCSDVSSGGGWSSCSFTCEEVAQMDW